MERNQYDSDGCLERGLRTEDLFLQAAKHNDWKVIPATPQEDINEHWDFKIVKESQSFKVDVKGLKKISRSDSAVQDEWIWIELHGVRENDKGWLYGSKADLISFEKKKSFIIVKRVDLMNKILKVIDLTTLVPTARDAKYKIYQRVGRPDKITLIQMNDLESIKWEEWEKTHL
jgi:hypothetical protein